MSSIKQIIQDVAIDKNLDLHDIHTAIEYAIIECAYIALSPKMILSCKFDSDTDQVILYSHQHVVQEVQFPESQITLQDALLLDSTIKIEETIKQIIPTPEIDKNRILLRKFNIYLSNYLENIRRAKEYSKFITKVGEIVHGVVKRTSETGQLLITIEGTGVGILNRENRIPTELTSYNVGDPIEVLIESVEEIPVIPHLIDGFNITKSIEKYLILINREVTPENIQKIQYNLQHKKHQIMLSRTSNKFLYKLLERQVPEIANQDIEIKSIARKPGKRAKIAVYSENSNLDPVRICVGHKGCRIETVRSELKGERIDIIQYSSDPAEFAIRALKPGNAIKAIYKPSIDKNTLSQITLIIDDNDKRKAIGASGVNVQLAAKLCKCEISLLTLEEFQKIQSEITTFLEIALVIDTEIAALLVSKGFENIEDLRTTDITTISNETGMDLELTQAIKTRVEHYIKQSAQFYDSNPQYIHFRNIPKLRTIYVQELIKHNIHNITDLATQQPEFLEQILAKFNISRVSIDRLMYYAKNDKTKQLLNNSPQSNFKTREIAVFMRKNNRTTK